MFNTVYGLTEDSNTTILNFVKEIGKSSSSSSDSDQPILNDNTTILSYTNLSKETTWEDGYFIDVNTGEQKDISNSTSDFIPIDNTKTYFVSFVKLYSKAIFVRVNYYDSNQTCISGELTTVRFNYNEDERQLNPVPSTAEYAKFSVDTNKKQYFTLYIK